MGQMQLVLGETYNFLCEQQARLEEILRERQELRGRLCDALEHLRAPEFSDIASDVAAEVEDPEGPRGLVTVELQRVKAHMQRLDTMAHQRALRQVEVVPPSSWSPPPTI